MRNLLGASLLALFLLGCTFPPEPPEKQWFKGNTHTHTLWSDGDGASELIADWYKERGYHFLILSDHNVLSRGERWKTIGKGHLTQARVDVLIKRFGKEAVEIRNHKGGKQMRLQTLEEIRKRFEEPGRFLLIEGEEITDQFKGKPIHHNSMNQTNLIKPTGGTSVRDVMEKTVRAVEAEAKKTGKPVLVHLNHPNYGWAVTPDDLAHVLGERYFEVYNGHRGVRNYGDKNHPSMEATWDHVLTLRLDKLKGQPLYGLATDDAHNYHKQKATANPGRGWIYVRADKLDADAIMRAMMAGDFYSSSGVVLKDVRSDKKSLTIEIESEEGVTYLTRFIGRAGRVLQESKGSPSRYDFKGDELYVRATVVSTKSHPNGYGKNDVQTAWVQPVVVK